MKLRSGVLGKSRGKVGPLVCAIWKGINYAKEYVVPANPQSEKQVYQRDRMAFAQMLASFFLTSLVQIFWKQYEEQSSAYNEFISYNILQQDDYDTGGPTFSADYSKARITKGSLEPIASITSWTYDTATGAAVVAWDETVVGNGSLTDKVVVLIWDKANKVGYIATDATRDDETDTLTLPTGLTATNLEGYLGVAKADGSLYITGISVHQQLVSV